MGDKNVQHTFPGAKPQKGTYLGAIGARYGGATAPTSPHKAPSWDATDGSTCPLPDTAARHPNSRGASGLLGLFVEPLARGMTPPLAPSRKATPPIAEEPILSPPPGRPSKPSPSKQRIPDDAFDALAGRHVGAIGGYTWNTLRRTLHKDFKGTNLSRIPLEEWR